MFARIFALEVLGSELLPRKPVLFFMAPSLYTKLPENIFVI